MIVLVKGSIASEWGKKITRVENFLWEKKPPEISFVVRVCKVLHWTRLRHTEVNLVRWCSWKGSHLFHPVSCL